METCIEIKNNLNLQLAYFICNLPIKQSLRQLTFLQVISTSDAEFILISSVDKHLVVEQEQGVNVETYGVWACCPECRLGKFTNIVACVYGRQVKQ